MLLLALTLSSLVRLASALDLIAASQVQSCTDSGGGLASSVNCSYMLLISAAIQNAEAYGTGTLQYSLTAAAGATGFPQASSPLSLMPADTVSIIITQSSISYIYPLTYLQDFNDAPYEVLMGSDSAGHAFNLITNPCQDSASSSTPACGWTSTAAGVRVPYSQGLCCNCDLAAQGLGTTIPRSGLRCSLLGVQQGTASCLRMSPLWWSGFSIGPPRLSFTINLHTLYCRPTPAALAAAAAAALAAAQLAADLAGLPLTPAAAAYAAQAPGLTCTSPSPQCTCDQSDSIVTDAQDGLPPLGPALPTRCYRLPGTPPPPPGAPCDILFKLIGTFVPTAGVPDHTSKVLLVPSQCTLSLAQAPPDSPCFTALTSGWSNWLLVGASQVTLDGSLCNMVGSSYQAFNTQGGACGQPAGTCLGGSPSALLAADLARPPAQRRNLLTSFTSPTAPPGAGAPLPLAGTAGVLALQGARSGASAASTLAFVTPTGDFQQSLLTLTLRAAPGTFRMLANIAPGRILGAAAPAFTAGSTGALRVTVGSGGALASAFTLVAVCSAPALPISALPLTLPPATQPGNASSSPSSHTLQVSIVGTLGGVLSCNVSLLNALGGVSDSVLGLAVSVGALVSDRGSQGGELGGGAGGAFLSANASNAPAGACGTACASWLDVPCAVRSVASCGERLLAWGLGAGLGLLSALLLAVCLLRNPALLAAGCKAVGGAVCGGGKQGEGGAAPAPAATAPAPVAAGRARDAPRGGAGRGRGRGERHQVWVTGSGKYEARVGSSRGSAGEGGWGEEEGEGGQQQQQQQQGAQPVLQPRSPAAVATISPLVRSGFTSRTLRPVTHISSSVLVQHA